MPILGTFPNGSPLPTLTNPATAADIKQGKQVIGQDATIISGISTAVNLPTLSNPAGANEIQNGMQAIAQDASIINGVGKMQNFEMFYSSIFLPSTTETVSVYCPISKNVPKSLIPSNTIKLFGYYETMTPQYTYYYYIAYSNRGFLVRGGTVDVTHAEISNNTLTLSREKAVAYKTTVNCLFLVEGE